MNPNNLHGDHYGYGQENNNPTSSLTNAPKGQKISGLPSSSSGLNTSSGSSIDNGGLGAGITDHNAFAKAQIANGRAYTKDNYEATKESNNLKLVVIIGIILLVLIIIAIACVLFLKK